MRPRIAAVGDNVVDCYLERGAMFPGGNTLNVATFASRFGADSAYVGQIADDDAGRVIHAALEAEHVDTSRLRVVEGETAYCIVGHEGGHDRVFLASELGVSRFEPDADDLAFLAGFDVVHVGSSSGLDDWLADVGGLARLSYDFGASHEGPHLDSVGAHCFLAVLSGANLSEDRLDDLLERARSAGATWTLVTRGGRGAVLSDGAHRWSTAAHPIPGVVDTLGAGDTFCARVLVGLCAGESPDDFLPSAAYEAAVTCTSYGAFGRGAPLSAQVVASAGVR